MAKGKKSRTLIIFISVVAAILVLLLAALTFVGLTITSLESSMEQKLVSVDAAHDARNQVLDRVITTLKPKMSLDTEPFEELSAAMDKLKGATTVAESSEANLEVDKAYDRLIYVLRDRYAYLELHDDVLALYEDMDSANNRLTMAFSGYNTDAEEYNYTITNFPGDFLAMIFGFEQAETITILKE